MVKLIQNKDILEIIPSKVFRLMSEWVLENVMAESIMTIENWMEIAFHLCKQRWDASIDWLENQPMSKIKLMIEINKKFAEQQEEEMNKARRKR